jgi:arylformamidase
MAVYDISLPISDGLVTWPGDPPVAIRRVADLAAGDTATVSQISMGTHSGTHIDAPSHFFENGAYIDGLALETLIGPALVVETGDAAEITAGLLDRLAIAPATERLLFHTRNSALWREHHEFARDFVALTEDGALWLAAAGVRLVGLDYLSIAPFRNPVPIHKTMLANNIVVVEGLNLSAVKGGIYHLICLPLRLVGCEAAPARAVLLTGAVDP